MKIEYIIAFEIFAIILIYFIMWLPIIPVLLFLNPELETLFTIINYLIQIMIVGLVAWLLIEPIL